MTAPLPSPATPPRGPSAATEQAARSALQSITNVLPPPNADADDWAAMSSAEQLAIVSPASPVMLARAEVRNGRILVAPERSDFPAVTLPNNVGAEGFSPGWRTHDYLVEVCAPPGLRGPAALAAISAALVANPTPGKDFPATSRGTENNVGHLTGIDHGSNLVRSFRIASTDARRSATVVNYTVKGQHTMEEGFVLRFAELKADGSVVLITYGEGDAWRQLGFFSPIWWKNIKRIWRRNALEILRSAWSRSR